ncbi:hypothetical protein HDU97_008694 [Phlyctochytrium planicorne]|nr:hypothetical protein HDU97_008694 [Phlyctochytrium planicorne]
MRTRSISNPTPGGLFKTQKEPSSNLVNVDSTILSASHIAGSGSLTNVDPTAQSPASSNNSLAGDVAGLTTAASPSKGLMGMRKRASSSTAAGSAKSESSAVFPASASSSPSNSALAAPRPTRGNKLFLHARSFYNGSSGPSSPASEAGSSPGTPTSMSSGAALGAGYNTAPRASQANSIQFQPRASQLTSPVGGSLKQLTLAEFKLMDTRPRRQRHVLHSLIVNDIKVRMEERMDGVRETRKAFKEPKFKEEKKGLGKLGGLLQKKKKKKTRGGMPACIFLEELSTATLRKKLPLQANRVFLSAMVNSMESVCMVMLDKGFPVSVNAPFSSSSSGNSTTTGNNGMVASVGQAGKRLPVVLPNSASNTSSSSLGVKGPVPMSSVDYPSYFVVAVALGLDNVIRSMIKRSDINQTWHGLTALHIAASRNAVLIVNLLLEHGADPNKGIYLSQYALLRKYKAFSPNPNNPAFQIASSVGTKPPALTGSSIGRQHPAGADPTWSLPNSSISESIAGSALTGATTSSQLEADIRDTGSVVSATSVTDGKKAESPVSLDSSLRPVSVLAKENPVIKGLKGKLAKFPEEYLKGRKVYPVELAAASGHIDVVKTLLPRMDPKIVATLSFAILVQRNVEMTVIFLRYGAPWNQKDQKGSSPIHLGARAGDLNYVIALQQCGVDVNVRGENDWTPLHEAISQKKLDVASYLVRNGADLSLISANGETARDLGVRIGISPSDLDEYLSPLRTLSPAMIERETNAINQVKFIRFTTDHNSGPRPLGPGGKGMMAYADGASSPSSSLNGGVGSLSPANAYAGSLVTSPSGGSPIPGSPSSVQRLSTTITSSSSAPRNKFASFLSSGRVDKDKAPGEASSQGQSEPNQAAEKMKGLLKGRFMKRSD